MYAVCVTIQVKPEHRDEFVRETLANARATRAEPARVRFDVLQADDDPNRFFLYEVCRAQSGFEAHQQTPHYLRWRETVKPWMAVPRVGVRHHSLFPNDAEW